VNLLAWALGLVALAAGCRASVSADANLSGSARASADGETDEIEQPIEPASLQPQRAAQSASSRVLLGARHDLRLAPGQSAPVCECLRVALGGASSPALRWSGEIPTLDDETQLAIALSSDGLECSAAPKESLGASYWGYRISGDDVIVVIEAARGGRPITSGAIVPRPVGKGQVFVTPLTKNLPYGRPLGAAGACRIGNPGRARSGAFTVLELGVDPAPTESGTSNLD
jgi:hypothetical protein